MWCMRCTLGQLPLCLHAQMRTRFFKGNLDLPVADEPRQDLFRFDRLLGAEKRLWGKFAKRIAYQHPAHWHRCHTLVIPNGGTGSDFDGLVSFTVPLG